jgi:hypothetical protein
VVKQFVRISVLHCAAFTSPDATRRSRPAVPKPHFIQHYHVPKRIWQRKRTRITQLERELAAAWRGRVKSPNSKQASKSDLWFGAWHFASGSPFLSSGPFVLITQS